MYKDWPRRTKILLKVIFISVQIGGNLLIMKWSFEQIFHERRNSLHLLQTWILYSCTAAVRGKLLKVANFALIISLPLSLKDGKMIVRLKYSWYKVVFPKFSLFTWPSLVLAKLAASLLSKMERWLRVFFPMFAFANFTLMNNLSSRTAMHPHFNVCSNVLKKNILLNHVYFYRVRLPQFIELNL